MAFIFLRRVYFCPSLDGACDQSVLREVIAPKIIAHLWEQPHSHELFGQEKGSGISICWVLASYAALHRRLLRCYFLDV